jgi:hypothetical protein
LFVSGLTKQEPAQEFDIYVLVVDVSLTGFSFVITGERSIHFEGFNFTRIRVVDEDSDEMNKAEVQRLVSLRQKLCNEAKTA